MAITYTWTVNPLKAYPTHGGETDVVFRAYWQLNAISGSLEESGSVYQASTAGDEAITYHSGSEFIPFEELTLPVVQGWVEDALGEEQINNMKAQLAINIENQINPPTIILQSPWLNRPSGSL